MKLKNGLATAGALLALVLGSGPSALAGSFTLSDGNSTVHVDTESSAGMDNWTVDGTNHLYQQWFWFRVGDTGPEASIDTLSIDVEGTTDTNFTGSDNNLFVRYGTADTFYIEINYNLQGGAPGSHGADIAEQIKITNNTNSDLDFHFFQYSDFDLDDESSNQSVTILGNGMAARHIGSNVVLSETVVTPTADHFQVGGYPSLLDSLNDSFATTLTNVSSFGPGNATWAFQWDRVISAGSSFQISKDKQIAPVPEPGTIFLFGSGLMGLAAWRMRKNKANQ